MANFSQAAERSEAARRAGAAARPTGRKANPIDVTDLLRDGPAPPLSIFVPTTIHVIPNRPALRINGHGPKGLVLQGSIAMDLPGKRYRTLADRCRQSAIAAPSETHRSALLKMARGYDRRALEYETDAACA